MQSVVWSFGAPGVCVLLSVFIISFQMYFMYLFWGKTVVDTVLKASFRPRQDYGTFYY